MNGFDQDDFVNFINQKWIGDKTCPLCGVNCWAVGPIVAPNLFERGAVVFGGKMIPMIPLICESCGYMMFFNPAVTQLIKSEQPAEKTAEPENP